MGMLIDVHILESKINDLKLSFDSSRLVYNTLEQEIFKEHETTEEAYRKSYQFYTMNIALLDDVYAIIVDSLNFMEKSSNLPRLLKKPITSPLKTDSLKIDSLKLNSLKFDSLKLDSLKIDSLKIDSIKVMPVPGALRQR